MDENMIIYNLLSERYHELLHKPRERDEKVFREINNLFHKYKEKVHSVEVNEE